MPDRITHLLDTHAWVWLVSGSDKGAKIKQLPFPVQFGVAAISVWEVGMLERKGKLKLLPNPAEWINQALNDANIHVVPLTPEIALYAAHLPRDFHGDPADRMIIATAHLVGACLVTADRHILAYAARRRHRVVAL